MKLKIFLIFFALTISKSYGQTKVLGVITNELNSPLSSANIQIINPQSNKTVAFGVSDNDGKFSIASGLIVSFSIKVTLLGYEAKLIKIENYKENQLIKITLLEYKNQLEEVLIKAKENAIKQRGDTITYTVDRFMNGTEQSLKDVLKKLPGIDINNNGKITANGKEIDKLLIDGEDFFNNQHQLATENVTASMIKNVELLKNYKEFDTLETDEKSGTTAINITIKEEFKNKITGNSEVLLGYNSKFNLNTNLFSFRKKAKIALLSDSNNLGKQGISLNNYYELLANETTNKNSGSNVEFSNNDDAPKFLTSGNNVKERKTIFNALNLVYNPSKKTKINLFSIFNIAIENKDEQIKQVFFSQPNDFQNDEITKSDEKNIFNSTKIETIFKPNSTTIFNYTINLNLNEDKNILKLNNYANDFSLLFYNNDITKLLLINSDLSFSKKINKKSTIKAYTFYTNDTSENEKTIDSQQPFLDLNFENDDFNLTQNNIKKSKKIGLNIEYSTKFKFGIFNYFTNSNQTYESFNNSAFNQESFRNNINLEMQENQSGFNVNLKFIKNSSIDLGVKYNYLSRRIVNETSFSKGFILPSVGFKININENNVLKFSYNFSNTISNIETLFDQKVILNYRSVYSNQNINLNSILPSHQINLNYFYFKFPKFSLITNFNYSFKDIAIGTNSFTNNVLNETIYRLTPSEKIFSGMYYIEKTFDNLPLSFLNSMTLFHIKKIIFNNDIASDFESNSLSFYSKFTSKLKKTPFNFEIGCVFDKNLFQATNSKSFTNTNQFFINLVGKLGHKLIWNLESSYRNQKSNLFDESFFILSPSANYIKTKKWSFSIVGSNILNIENPINLLNTSSSLFLEEKRISSLTGYILVGTKFKF